MNKELQTYRLFLNREWYNEGDFNLQKSLEILIEEIKAIGLGLEITLDKLKALIFKQISSDCLSQVKVDGKDKTLISVLQKLAAEDPQVELILWTEGDLEFQNKKIESLGLVDLEKIVAQDKALALESQLKNGKPKIYVLDDKEVNLVAIEVLAGERGLEIVTYLVDLAEKGNLQQIINSLKTELAENENETLILIDLDRVVLDLDLVWQKVSQSLAYGS